MTARICFSASGPLELNLSIPLRYSGPSGIWRQIAPGQKTSVISGSGLGPAQRDAHGAARRVHAGELGRALHAGQKEQGIQSTTHRPLPVFVNDKLVRHLAQLDVD